MKTYDYVYFNNKRYYKGAVFTMNLEGFKGEKVKTVKEVFEKRIADDGYNQIVTYRPIGPRCHKQVVWSEEKFNARVLDAREGKYLHGCYDPVIHGLSSPVSQNAPAFEKARGELRTAWVFYILAMFASSVFVDKWLLWIVITVIFCIYRLNKFMEIPKK